MFEYFAANVLLPDKNIFVDENADLNNMAVIESAYLSAKTAMPESPVRIMQMADKDFINILASGTKKIV